MLVWYACLLSTAESIWVKFGRMVPQVTSKAGSFTHLPSPPTTYMLLKYFMRVLALAHVSMIYGIFSALGNLF